MSKLDGIKAGDRFSVTMQGEVRAGPDDEGDMLVRYDGTASSDYIFAAAAADPSFQITRIDRALAVGDEVIILGKHKGKVLGFLSNGNVAVEYQAGDTSWCGPYHPSCLTHA